MLFFLHSCSCSGRRKERNEIVDFQRLTNPETTKVFKKKSKVKRETESQGQTMTKL